MLDNFLLKHGISPRLPLQPLLRSEVIEWLDDHFEEIMENPCHRKDFATWLVDALDDTDRRHLHVITDFNSDGKRITSAGNPWRFVNYGPCEVPISLKPKLAANLYGSFLVELNGTPEQPIHAYVNVRLVGDKCDQVSLHDNARYMDTRPFYVDAWYIESPSGQDMQWEEYRLAGKTRSLLSEAHFCLETDYEDTVELHHAERSKPYYQYDQSIAEDDDCSVTYNPVCDSYTVYAKVDPDMIYDWWDKSQEPYASLTVDLQELIKEHVQAGFWYYPNGECPVPGHSYKVATYDRNQDLILVREKGVDSAKVQEFTYDYDCSLVQNMRGIAKDLEEDRSLGNNRSRASFSR